MDKKLLGYSISTVSVLFLGIVAWPSADDPQWKAWAVAIGMATSVAGMFCRYLSHVDEQHDIKRAAEDEPPKHQSAAEPLP
jgi:hypothetical protein